MMSGENCRQIGADLLGALDDLLGLHGIDGGRLLRALVHDSAISAS